MAFTSAEFRVAHDFRVGCLTFARNLLPLQSFNDFLGHYHHCEWNGLGHPLKSMIFRWFWILATIGNNSFFSLINIMVKL